MTQREDDLKLLNVLLKEHSSELTDAETEVLVGMRFDLTAYDEGMFLQLTDKQRTMVTAVRERLRTMTQRTSDLTLLNELLNSHVDELTDVEMEAFASMRFDLQAYGGILGPESASGRRFQQLTADQRVWVMSAHERIVGKPSTRLTAGEIPRGREVPLPPVLQNLPRRPPPLPKPVSNGPPRASRRHCGRTDEGCYAFVNGDCTCGCCS